MTVPFLDLKSQYETIKDEVDEAIRAVVERSAFAGGPFVEIFEKAWASYCGCDHAVGVGSGTEALWAALLAVGVSPGDAVVTVPNTFIATAEAISFCGAEPVFVDIDERTFNMDPARLEAFLAENCAYDRRTRTLTDKATNRTVKAVIPVHLYGQMADMAPIMAAAKEYNLPVIEDASQAHGAEDRGRRAGSVGRAGCFSFYPGKNLGAFGEAGAVVTNDEDLARTMRIFRDHGQGAKYHHRIIGWNSRMDGIQGAVLSVKLRHIDDWNDRRRRVAGWYRNRLTEIDGLALPDERAGARHVYHVYAVRCADRDRLIDDLKAAGIHCGIHYPVPIHLQDAYAHLGLPGDRFPVSETCAKEMVSLPMYPDLAEDQIEAVCTAVENAIRGRRRN